MATESEGFWAERSWLFIALCRQLGIDAGLITYTKGNVLEPRLPRPAGTARDGAGLLGATRPSRARDRLALRGADRRQGLPLRRPGRPARSRGPAAKGVATLDQAMADPAILERMNLPGQSPYGTSRASLLASPTKIGILIDSSQGFFSPKMKPAPGASFRARTGRSSIAIPPSSAITSPRCWATGFGDRSSSGDAPGGRDPALHRPQFVRVDQSVAVPLPSRVSRWSIARIKQLRGELDRGRSRNTSRSG